MADPEKVFADYVADVEGWKTRVVGEMTVPTLDLGTGELFPEQLSRVRSLSGIDPDVARAVAVHELYGLLEYFIWLEQAIVPRATLWLDSDKSGLNTTLRKAAVAINEQEHFHSLWAYEVEFAVRDATGIPLPTEAPTAIRRLARIVAAVAPEGDDERRAAEAVSITIAEVLDSGFTTTFCTAPRLNGVPQSWATRHEREEALHRAAFSSILTALASGPSRPLVDRLIDPINELILGSDPDGDAAMRSACGLDDNTDWPALATDEALRAGYEHGRAQLEALMPGGSE